MNESTEWLKYEFDNETHNGATVNLLWEKLKIPFKVEVDLHRLQLESFKRELRTDKSFNSTSWQQAAQYTLTNNVDLQQGLEWADKAISTPFFGEANFQTLFTKAQILSKIGNNAEADSLMKKALPMGNMNQVHQYARQLLAQKKHKEAFEVFKLNSTKYPDAFTTDMGMMRAYSAEGNYKKALDYALKAIGKAPDPGNKASLERFIKTLGEGKDIN